MHTLGVSDKYFLDIQDDIDIRNAKIELKLEIEGIKKFDYLCEIDVQAQAADSKVYN